MSKRTRIILIVIVLAIVAYFAYRWWQNRNSGGLTSNTAGTGSNLNSVAPELAGGSTGPDSGLNYYPGNTQLDISVPGAPTETENNSGNPAPKPKPKPKPPHHPTHLRPGGGSAGSPGTPGGPPIPRPIRRRPPTKKGL